MERCMEGVFQTVCHISLSWIKRSGGYSFGSGYLIGQFQKQSNLIKKVMENLGATGSWENVGQVYPRSLDFEVVSLLFRSSIGSGKFC